MLHLALLEKQEQGKPQRSKSREIKIRAKINGQKNHKRINETKCFFEKINKINKPPGKSDENEEGKDPNL
jgi:hypothetical protein